ncbi:SH3 domain-containing protein [Planctomycetota bacterium]|nr:SH3 domain-containing protein [Planctomycetota bacterium]
MNRLRKLGGYGLFFLMAVAVMGFTWAADGPFVAEVTKDNVDVMSGAGKRVYYKMGQLKKGDQVVVRGRLFGWYRIECPTGVYSYVSKAFVDLKGDRTIGVVNKDGTEVKAGMMGGKEGDHSRVQLLLNEGDTVKIVGEAGNSLYKIIPPKEATAFVEPGSLTTVTTAQQLQREKDRLAAEAAKAAATEVGAAEKAAAAEVEAAQAAAAAGAKKPVDAATEKPGTTQKPTIAELARAAAAGKKPADAAKTPGLTLSDKTKVAAKPGEVKYLQGDKGEVLDESNVSKELKALDAKMQELMKKNLEEQPLDVMIAAYEKMLARKDVSDIDKEVVKIRVESLKHNKKLLMLLAALEEAEKPVKVEVPKEEVVVIEYDAVGQLLASAVYDGTTLPRMYRLVDPASNRTLVYVKPGQLVDGRATLGRLVGIVGSQQFDQSLKLNVIKVEKIDVLEKSSKK